MYSCTIRVHLDGFVVTGSDIRGWGNSRTELSISEHSLFDMVLFIRTVSRFVSLERY